MATDKAKCGAAEQPKPVHQKSGDQSSIDQKRRQFIESEIARLGLQQFAMAQPADSDEPEFPQKGDSVYLLDIESDPQNPVFRRMKAGYTFHVGDGPHVELFGGEGKGELAFSYPHIRFVFYQIRK